MGYSPLRVLGLVGLIARFDEDRRLNNAAFESVEDYDYSRILDTPKGAYPVAS